mmetsp:Transcript_79924/g.232011  ORF Transcript_79924/g.232011 Transcript_79924/m.232011 type:complete len:408 (+) Transcript_79924:31-1254(+)
MIDPGDYDGEVNVQGLRHGRGRYTYPNTFFTYDGEWVEGQKHGQGKLILGDGSLYEGEFKNGEIEGQGRRTWASGAEYTGQFHMGEKHGTGTLSSGGGVRYEGGWQHNQRHGRGTLTGADGSVYEGDFVLHRQTGQGKMVTASGEEYVGQWHDGVKHGSGTMMWPDGARYEGEWHEGIFHGQGAFSGGESADGTQRMYTGVWAQGVPEAQAAAIEWEGLVPPPEPLEGAEVDEEGDAEGARSAEVAQPPVEEGPWALTAGAVVPAFVVRCLAADGSIAEFESGRELTATLRRRAQREVVPEKGKKGKKSPEPEEPPPPTAVISEVLIGSARSASGRVVFNELLVPADTEPTTYDGEYELAFSDSSPEHPVAPIVRIAAEACDFSRPVRIEEAPPPPEEEEGEEDAAD